ncbi:MAG: acyl-CoA dehydrogenase family protein [Syntrophaceae bacterium]|nr:acyl-CoA dehydrogenase family protein [Syntrophaceae bacterium]
MDYELSAEQKKLKADFRAFCNKEIAPRAPSVDKEGAFSFENHRRLAEIGFLGLPFPEEYGGGGKPLLTCALAWEELARACPSTFLSSGIGCLLPGMAVHLFGNGAQREKYLAGLTRGDKIPAWALTEPQTGSDFAALKTQARKQGSSYTLDGTKSFVTNGAMADWVVVVAVTQGEAPLRQKLSAFLMEKGTPGFSAGKPLDTLGARGSPTSDLNLQDCTLSGGQLLGEEGQGFALTEKVNQYGRLSSAAYCLGIAQACLEESILYAQKRQAFGRPIAHFQEVSFKIADMQMFVDTGRLLLYRAAWMMDEGMDADTDLSIAKLFLSESATWCAAHAVQVHGGHGFIKGVKVEQLYRDAKLGEIRDGTSEMQRRKIARNLLGEGFR